MIQISRRNIPDVLIDPRLIQLSMQTCMQNIEENLKYISRLKLLTKRENKNRCRFPQLNLSIILITTDM